jgi:hypothetical protein
VGNVSIDLKQGNDNLRVTGPATFPADVEVKTGFGNDFITFFTAPPDLITVAGDLSIKSGQGDDFLDLRRLAITGNAEIDTSDGADRVFFDDDSTVGGNLNVRLGHGNDTLGLGFIGTLSIGGHLQVNASLGDDTVNIDNTTGTTAEIDTSDGIDTVNITASTFTELTVRLGLGDDILSITDSTVTGTADLNGSSGIDTFNNLGVNVFGTLLTKKFEL